MGDVSLTFRAFTERPKLIEVRKVRVQVLLAALANASRFYGGLHRWRITPDHVRRTLETFRRIRGVEAEYDSPDFIAYFLNGAPVVIVSHDPLVIDVRRFDAAYGEGLAEQVIAKLHATGDWDARDLCRIHPEPVPLWKIFAAIAFIGFMLALLIMLRPFPPLR